jgi:hypothetical protein
MTGRRQKMSDITWFVWNIVAISWTVISYSMGYILGKNDGNTIQVGYFRKGAKIYFPEGVIMMVPKGVTLTREEAMRNDT